ncbi:MAG: DNA-processing protein DprA [Candidatus Adiutrix sp.]|jgi:DNA processing protein|nr:DNA-processing protein DprA [Candidatus Adiutrix sp.]
MWAEGRGFDEQERLARLALYLGLQQNPAHFHKVMQRLGSALAAFEGQDFQIRGLGFGPLLTPGLFEEAQERRQAAEKAGLAILVWGDEDYPPRLMEIPEPPPVLWVRGRLEPQDRFAVALVGSRAASRNGLYSARRLGREGAACGLTIVSGLAKGIDAQAHQGALEAGGRTLAVLGCGLDWVYPKENARLYEEIASAGALISEFVPETRPHPVHFPRRNRIIAGLSLALVVVEAGPRSGALISARLALDLGREVLAMPGPAGAGYAQGAHRLIKNGAALVENMGEVLAEIKPRLLEGLSPPDPGSPPPPADSAAGPEAPQPLPAPESAGRLKTPAPPAAGAAPDFPPGSAEARLLALLQNGPRDSDSLGREGGFEPAELAMLLLTLELGGRLRLLPSGQYGAV